MDREDEVERLCGMCRNGWMRRALKQYICQCVECEDRQERRFPNAAGFARYLGVSVAALKAFGEREPEAYGRICAVLEDEALNADISVTLAITYLKERLGYEERAEREKSERGDGQTWKLVFEHNIEEDGE